MQRTMRLRAFWLVFAAISAEGASNAMGLVRRESAFPASVVALPNRPRLRLAALGVVAALWGNSCQVTQQNAKENGRLQREQAATRNAETINGKRPEPSIGHTAQHQTSPPAQSRGSAEEASSAELENDTPRALQAWESAQLPSKVWIEVRATAPYAQLDQLGQVSLTAKLGETVATVSGSADTLFDADKLADRARGHEQTEIALEIVGTRQNAVILRVDLMTVAGEDVRTVHTQTSLWSIPTPTPGLGLSLVNLWSGDGGTFHSVFDACLYGVDVAFEVLASGSIKRHCVPSLFRNKKADLYQDCPLERPSGCASSTILTFGEAQP